MVSHLSLISISAKESVVLLSVLDCNLCLQINIELFVNQIYAKCVKHFVHFVHDVRILHHLSGVEPYKVVLAHIVSQICKYKCTFLGLID